MTKEQLRNELDGWCNITSKGAVKKILDEFFSQNVCIPKGIDRHQYADVLHEWIEGAEIQKMDLGNQWWDIKDITTVMSQIGIKDGEYRIKPSEPEFEYQWIIVINGNPLRYGFHTKEDVKSIWPNHSVLCLEETKRIRQ